jgi:hypothetical protein
LERKAWFFAALPQKMRHDDRKKINALALKKVHFLLVFLSGMGYIVR